ncbi:hypothetical protein MUCCIDRAFT_108838 [Mucor lusitanicus CBS 277.49]|uniref:Uncharacterized protein n=1 Tax=Mucor lusitanicus CBS 277.49 TaxID=747725 RepID=A0A168MIJ3_MUCCL|nr:hypothetical protein MUCCIDRAFT_108838 [Mucor lusitanicus CBS 277.49]
MACHAFKSRFQECFDHDNKLVDFPRNPIVSRLNSSSSARQFTTHSDNNSYCTVLRKCNSLPTQKPEEKNASIVVAAAPISVTSSPRSLSSTVKTTACSLKRRNHIRRKKRKMYNRQRSCNSSSSSLLQSHPVTAATAAATASAVQAK